MKVKMIRNAKKALNCPLLEGQSGDVDESLGAVLLGLGVAERLDDAKTVKAVPDQPAIAEASPATIAGDKSEPEVKTSARTSGKSSAK